MPGVLDTGVFDRSGKLTLDLAPEPPQFPREAVDQELDYGAINSYLQDAANRLREDPYFTDPNPDSDYDIRTLAQLGLSRIAEIHSPTPSDPELGFPSAGHEQEARRAESMRTMALMAKLQEVARTRRNIQSFAAENPDLAAELGIDDEHFWTPVKDLAVKAARKGWGALDFLLRNIDRPRGALAAYAIARQEGANPLDARKAARAVLTGSERGWRIYPTQLGPSWKEFLVNAGLEDDLGTKTLGLGADILIDPINIIGLGASRKGIEIGAHQILNSAGRKVYGTLLREERLAAMKALRLGSEIELPIDEVHAAATRTAARMRELVRTDLPTARRYLDLGGLKIAGYTLPGTAYIRRQAALRRGYEFDYVSDSLIKMFGRGSMKGVDVLGGKLAAHDNNWLSRNLGKFMKFIPETLEAAGRKVGLLVNRTNPAAGKEYSWFKQAEYYDLLGASTSNVRDRVHQIFHGIKYEDLKELPFKMEEGPEALAAFVSSVAMRRGVGYGTRLSMAVNEYRAAMDDIIIDEVKRGWLGADRWNHTMRAQFEQWVRRGRPQYLPPELLDKFNRVYTNNYVPHYYHNIRKVHKLFPPPSTPRAPSITEPFTHERKVPTLQDAVSSGFTPETNLAVLAAIRMNAHGNAVVTSDFLEEVASKYGVQARRLSKDVREAWQLAGRPLPQQTWAKILKHRLNANGRVAMPMADQLEAARIMAQEAAVDPLAVARLDDTAISEFLVHRLRAISPYKSRQMWKKYVAEATARGIYDGYSLAPAPTFDKAMVAARELRDEFYPDWTMLTAGGLADPKVLRRVYLPTPIVEDLERLRPQHFSQELQGILKLWDVGNFWWKRNVTILFPAFHVRNKLTNVLNSMLDIGIGASLNRRSMWDIVGGKDGVLKTPHAEYSYSQVRQMARRFGVYRSVYRRHDVVRMMQDVIRSDARTASVIEGKLRIPLRGRASLAQRGELVTPESIRLLNPYQAGTDIGSLIENGDRMMLFVKSLERGLPPDQAARRVNQFLFDYDDISNIEKNVVRRFFNPFWTWTRKNIALQAREALRFSPDVAPNIWTAPGKFARALSSEDKDAMRSDVERELLPQYLGDTFGVRVDTQGPLSRWLLNIDFPHDDLNRLWKGDAASTMRDWMASIGPVARELLESATDQDFWRGQDRVHHIGGTRVYDKVKLLKGTKLGNWLNVRETTWRDQQVVTVDADRWRALTWMTAWQLTRFYSTVGRFTDPKSGSVTQRLFNFLTGMRMEYVNPGDELRDMADAVVFDEDVGLGAQYKRMWDMAQKANRIRQINEREGENYFRMLDDAVETPETPNELPDGDSLVEALGI